jgi:hypothetical protein
LNVQFVQNLPDERLILLLTTDAYPEFSANPQFVSPPADLATSMATFSVPHA